MHIKNFIHYQYNILIIHLTLQNKQNGQFTWNSDAFPDFSLCFEETVLTWLPCLLLFVISFINLAILTNRQVIKLELPLTIFWVTKIVRNSSIST